MRVDGPSCATQTISSGDTGKAEAREVSESNVVREEGAPGAQGPDSTSRFEDAPAAHRERLLPPPPPPAPEPPPEPWPVPEKNLKRGDTGEDVKQLQDALVELGYLTHAQVATGPGLFGPQTEAALEKFQKDNGVTANGHYEAATREALSKSLARSAQTGGKTQQPALSAEAAFITQFTSEYNPHGPTGSTNCGPASLAMSLAYTGHMPAGLTKEQQVDHARALMSPRRASEFTFVNAADGTRVPMLDRDHEFTGGTMVADGIQGAGLTSRYGQGWESLDQQLAAGNPVIANGATNADWRSQFPERMGRGDIAHLNAILAKTPDGKYLVADPLHTGGPVAMTRQQLSVFFSPTGGQPSFNALQGASRGAGAGATAGASAGASASTTTARLLDEAAARFPPFKPEPFTLPAMGVGVANVAGAGAAGTDVQTRAQQDAKVLAGTLQNSLEQGAAQFEQLIASNPDPAYQEAFVRAAEPSLAKMGQLFAGVSPETDRKLHPRPPLRPPDLTRDRPLLDKLAEAETAIEQKAYLSLARATERLGEPTAGLVGRAFTRDTPPGFANFSLSHAIRTAVNVGIGSRLAFDMERALNVSEALPPGFKGPTRSLDAKAIHQTLWSAIDGLRTPFAAVADKAEKHQARLTELLSGPAKVLTPEQQQAFTATYLNDPERKHDLAEFERLSTLLARAAPDGPPSGDQGPEVVALARELPRMAETQSGAEYLASQLTAQGEGRPAFLDTIGKLKDLKDFDEKLALALVKSAGSGAILAAGLKWKGGAEAVFNGLAKNAHLFGMKPKDMQQYVKLLRGIKPDSTQEQVRGITRSLKDLLENQETGLPGNPKSPQGQALRGLGVLVTASAAIGDAAGWNQADFAAKLKIVGDGLSVGGEGGTVILSALGKAAPVLSNVLGKASGAGALLGVVGDGIQSFQAVQEGKYWKAGASGAQSLGALLMAGGALTEWVPGGQLVGAALFLGGLAVKYLDPDQYATRGAQVRLLTESGMDGKLAQDLIDLGPDLLDKRLRQEARMSPEQVQQFITDHPELAREPLQFDSLSQGANAMGMKGADYPAFLERLAKAHGVDVGTLAAEVHTRFFGHPPSGGASQGQLSPAEEFRQWVEARTPEVAAWAKQHRTP
ncbi:peptidoglycan-binding protein [Corallococcus sp. CA053C]|uniref:peptidoglycan-binding protein n=1 Tax=Corallococcus sp. CA053C TaxID=2316732 RepID=UPI0018F596E0|nr:peptidoglycan-binding protein [Corallococcus sp. CA053C]